MKVIQGSGFLMQVLLQAQSGALLPAAFQRPYVWSKQDVLALADSILKGYPVGSFLLWSPNTGVDWSVMARPRLGPRKYGEGATPVSLLLDGQNRLATLAWLAYDYKDPLPSDLSAGEAAVWDAETRLVLDLESQQFMFVPLSEVTKGLRLPSRVVTDSRLASQASRACWNGQWAGYSDTVKDEALRCLDLCLGAFSNARLTLTSIEHASAAEAKDAFLHICKVGVPMLEADFDAAVGWSPA